MLMLLRYSVTFQEWKDCFIHYQMDGTCLPTQTDSLIRLTLATLAADDHGDINVKLANVSNVNLNQCETNTLVESVGEYV